jgi:GTP-binding protein
MKIESADHFATAARPEELPKTGTPEIAFLGRSNVGKSSLINRLVNRKRLARTSGEPGKTRLLHLYRVRRGGRELLLADLPGYGFARVSKAERNRWRTMVESYLEDRPPALRAAVLLQDLRRDLTEDETLLVAWLEERGIPVVVALTKIDKLKPMRRAARVRELRRALEFPAARVVATSAQKGDGIAELWRAVEALIER